MQVDRSGSARGSIGFGLDARGRDNGDFHGGCHGHLGYGNDNCHMEMEGKGFYERDRQGNNSFGWEYQASFDYEF